MFFSNFSHKSYQCPKREAQPKTSTHGSSPDSNVHVNTVAIALLLSSATEVIKINYFSFLTLTATENILNLSNETCL